MEKPRKVCILSTSYFEILFSKESSYTAQLLSENADRLYELAQKDLKVENERKISVIISPDSDEFSINYTPFPYNRIIIYEALPDFSGSLYDDILLSHFYNVLCQQVLQNVKGDFEKKICRILKTDVIQPVYLENLTLEFIQGFQFLENESFMYQKNTTEELEDCDHGDFSETEKTLLPDDAFSTANPFSKKFNDGFFLQILSQAKLEGNFPSFIQATGTMDIYPGKQIALACANGFSSFLQQKWGYEKFAKFCLECGKFNLYSTEGTFHKIYGIPINQAWKEFESSVPLPSDLEKMRLLDDNSAELLSGENKGLYEHLIKSPYGIIWYDKFRHEVALFKPENNPSYSSSISSTSSSIEDFFNFSNLASNIYDFYKLSGLYGRKLLFLADNISDLSISNDGRFLAVSFLEKGYRENLQKNRTWIYDLKKRIFTGERFDLRNACIINFPDGAYGISGVYDDNASAAIRIYKCEKLNKILEKEKKAETSQKKSGIKENRIAKKAGFQKKNKNAKKEKENATDISSKLIHEKVFSADSIPFDLTYAGNGILYAILNSKGRQFLFSWNFYNDATLCYKMDFSESALPKENFDFTDEKELDTENQISAQKKELDIIIKNLSINDNPYAGKFHSSFLTFEYGSPMTESDVNFTKLGFIFLDEQDFSPSQIWLSKDNVFGGMHYPVIKNHDVFYSAFQYDHNKLKKIKISLLDFENIGFHEAGHEAGMDEVQKNILQKKLALEKKQGNGFFNEELQPYHQLGEIFKGSILFFMPVKEISVAEKAKLWPGLGVTFKSYSDRYAMNQLFISAGLGFLDLTFEKYTNPTEKIIQQLKQKREKEKMDFSSAILYENTSTIANLSAGAIYKGTKNEKYNFQALAGSALTIPLGMQFRELHLNFQTDYTASTIFRDGVYKNAFPNLNDSVNIFKSYQTISSGFTVEYTNIHQFGFSPYEQRGLSVGLTANIYWDLGLSDKKIQDTFDNLDDADLLEKSLQFTENSFFNPSQINLGFYASAKIPQLSLFKDYRNLILCFPTSIDFELFKNNGTAMDVKIETLVFGKEIQNGFNFLHIYFSRFGLKCAYDFSLIYDQTKVPLPDLRDFYKFYYSFVNTTVDDKFLLTARLDFIPAIGYLSSLMMHADFTYEYFIRNRGSKFSISLKLDV